MKFLQRKRWYRCQSAGLVEESTCGLIFRGALHSLEMWEWVWIIRSSVPLMDERTIGLNDLSNRRGGEVFDQSKSMSLNCARVDYLKRSTCDGGKRSIQCAAVPQTCWRANVPIYLSDVWRNYEWLCPAFLKWSCAPTGANLANWAASRRSTAQSINARSNDKRYRANNSQWLPFFQHNTIFVRRNAFGSSDKRLSYDCEWSEQRRNEEQMLSSVSAAQVCVYIHPLA